MPQGLKLYSFYSLSHRPLAEQWFLPSLKDNFLLCIDSDKTRGSGYYKDPSWCCSIQKKVSLILKALTENPNGVFVFSDVDIQFFKKTEPFIVSLMTRWDLAVLRDSPKGTLGTGFFACRSTPKTIRLWQDVERQMARCPEKHDQEALNDLWIAASPWYLRLLWKILSFLGAIPFLTTGVLPLMVLLRPCLGNRYGIRLGYFPASFFSPGVFSERIWAPGDALDIPRDVVLHHANWTNGVENKIAQLAFVRGLIGGEVNHAKT